MARRLKWLLGSVSALALLVLAGCGGSGGGTSGPGTIAGTAATGAPIVGGTVTVICAGGTATSGVSTDANGAYSVTTASGALPCVIRVVGGSGNSITGGLFSLIATAGATAHINQLTHMMVKSIARGDPTTLFTTGTANIVILFTTASIAAQKVIVQTVVDAMAVAMGLSVGFDFLSGTFGTVGTGFDKLLDNISFSETTGTASAAAPCIVFKTTNACILTITLATGATVGSTPAAGSITAAQVADLGGLQLFVATLQTRLFGLSAATFADVSSARTTLSDILTDGLFQTTVGNNVFVQVSSASTLSGVRVNNSSTTSGLGALTNLTVRAPTLVSVLSGVVNNLRVLFNFTASSDIASTARSATADVTRQSAGSASTNWKLTNITP